MGVHKQGKRAAHWQTLEWMIQQNALTRIATGACVRVLMPVALLSAGMGNMAMAAESVIVNNTNATGEGSLRNALNAFADATSGPFTITFEDGAPDWVYNINTTPTEITHDPAISLIIGNTDTPVTITNTGEYVSLLRTPPYVLSDPTTHRSLNLTFHNLTVQDCLSPLTGSVEERSGGVIAASQDVTFGADSTATFTGNTTYYGGTIYARQNVTFGENSTATFEHNTTNNYGGTIYARQNVTFGENSTATFEHNTTNNYGGAIYARQNVTFGENSTATFTGNTANSYGGAIYASQDVTFVNGSTANFTGNTAKYYGGAIYASLGNVTLTNTRFENNDALEEGGAIYMRGHDTQPRTLTYTTTIPVEGAEPVVLNPGDNGEINDVACRVSTNTTFNKAGPGPLTLNTVNQYWRGHTEVNEGTLIIGDSSEHILAQWGHPTDAQSLTIAGSATLGGYGTIYASNVTLHNNAMFDVSNTTPETIIRDLATDGDYDPDSGDGPATVNLGGKQLTVENANDTTYAGTITGTGSLTKSGAGTLTLSGENTYTGGTTLAAGTLALGHSSALGEGQLHVTETATLQMADENLAINNAMDIVPGKTATIDTNHHDTTYAGILTGGGSLTKTGIGTLDLTGDSAAFTGGIHVDAGRAKVNANYSDTPVVVASGAILGGMGTIQSLESNGITHPGNSIGTLHVAEDLTWGADHTYAVEVEPHGTSSRVEVGREATIHGTLAIIPEVGDYTHGPTYTILTSVRGITGEFATLAPATLQYTVSYEPEGNPTDIFLHIIGRKGFSELVSKGNGSSVAEVLDMLDSTPGSDWESVMDDLHDLSLTDLIRALNQMHPASQAGAVDIIANLEIDQHAHMFEQDAAARHTTHVRTLLQQMHPGAASQDLLTHVKNLRMPLHTRFHRAFTPLKRAQAETPRMGSSLSDLPQNIRLEGQRVGVWMHGFGRISDYDARGSSHDYIPGIRSHSAGTNVGLEYASCDAHTLGLTVGYTHSHYKLTDHYGKGSGDHYRMGLYHAWRPTMDWSVNTAVFYGYHQLKGQRQIEALNRTAHQHHTAHHVSAAAEVSRDVRWGTWTVTPFVGLGGMYLHEQGYTEAGAGVLNLVVRPNHYATFQGKTGAILSRLWMVGDTPVYGSVKLGYVHRRSLDRKKTFRASFIDQPRSFVVRASNHDAHLFNPGLGLTAVLRDDLALSCAYEAEIDARRQNHQALLQLTKQF